MNDSKELLGKLAQVRRLCTFLWTLGVAAAGLAVYYFMDSIPCPKLVIK